jgi:2-oxoglutarate ferredoxin oxidoreductase subunit alpha
VTGLYHDARGLPRDTPEVVDAALHRLIRKIELGTPEIQKYEEEGLLGATIGVVAYGSSARSAKAAIRVARERGLQVGLLRPMTLWPFPEAAVRSLGEQVQHIIVPEMNLGQLVLEVERVVAGRCAVHRVNRVTGEPIPPDEILAKIDEVAKA